MKPATRKITLNVPRALLEEATESTGKGITETVILGLDELRARKQRTALRALRGRVAFKLNLEKTRR